MESWNNHRNALLRVVHVPEYELTAAGDFVSKARKARCGYNHLTRSAFQPDFRSGPIDKFTGFCKSLGGKG